MPTADLRHGDCLDILRQLPDESVHAVITDPPYGLANTDSGHVVETLSRWFAGERDYLPSGSGFMGKAWDAFVPPPAVWDECFRVLKPGGHLLCFAGTRTVDLMGLSIRLAGFDLRDTIAWLTGSGFPKSLNVSKDKRFCQCEAVPYSHVAQGDSGPDSPVSRGESRPLCERCGKQIVSAGLGTALKPANEPCLVARKPLAKGQTVAANVLAHGTGALNVDACRVGSDERTNAPSGAPGANAYRLTGGDGRDAENARRYAERSKALPPTVVSGRWPANVVLDDEAADALDEQSGTLTSGRIEPHHGSGGASAGIGTYKMRDRRGEDRGASNYGDSGGASKFYPVFRYQAKAPARERPSYVDADGVKQAHATVKPLALMQWLVRLVTPPGGTVLEPFAGSGTTVEAALLEGFDVIGIEREADYLPLIQQRIDRVTAATTTAPEPEVDGLW